MGKNPDQNSTLCVGFKHLFKSGVGNRLVLGSNLNSVKIFSEWKAQVACKRGLVVGKSTFGVGSLIGRNDGFCGESNKLLFLPCEKFRCIRCKLSSERNHQQVYGVLHCHSSRYWGNFESVEDVDPRAFFMAFLESKIKGLDYQNNLHFILIYRWWIDLNFLRGRDRADYECLSVIKCAIVIA